jgi:hypothetical protein
MCYRMKHMFLNRNKHCDFYSITFLSCNKDFEDGIQKYRGVMLGDK